MEKLLNLLRRFLTWLDNLFGNVWTGQTGERPKQPYQEQRQPSPLPPVPAPTAEQKELVIGSDEPPVPAPTAEQKELVIGSDEPPVPAPTAEQKELVIGSDEPPAYRKSKSIVTYRERMLFYALRKAIENEYWIMSKVRMADFVWLANEPKDRRFHLNKILCKHVDFLLCTRLFLKPVLVIELDDPSHQWEGRAELDKFKDDTFASIGLPILRVKMQESYDVARAIAFGM